MVRRGLADRDWLKEHLADVKALVVRLGVRVDSELLSWAPGLTLVATSTTGLDHVDQKACANRGVEVISLRGETEALAGVTATSEHTVGLMIALIRKTVRAHQDVLQGSWNRMGFVGRELSALTLGVVGVGRLGRQVVGYAKSLGMRVVGSDPHVGDHVFHELGIPQLGLLELVERSDVVSLHVTYSPQTRGLIGRYELSRMKPGALLVNTSRGGLVDEMALLELLKAGHLGGAALDVLAGEEGFGESPAHPMIEYARAGGNVVLTPHVGGCTVESMEKAEELLAERVVAWWRSRPGHG